MINNYKCIAEKYLKDTYGEDAEFREGQYEAIQSVLENKRTLVVQKTGWGKSLIYFLSTRILRDMGKGPTIIISPLLSLMKNQVEAAQKLRLNAITINSTNKNDWEEAIKKVVNNECDLLLISPERLSNKNFIESVIYKIENSIGMFVVDEAHCISDWGHDFRPDYRRISRIISMLASNIPLLATTATANNRVVEDIKKQLGENLEILRGPLIRESIQIQTVKLKDQAERLAWIYENINKMSGTGIIYCLTVNDCELISKWLKHKGINVESYHANLSQDEINEREEKFVKNELKVLVATIKLGMGFDKPDIGFVIHFQRPGNVVSYYQQIGRAGRALGNSYAILLCGDEDRDIIEYFIKSAFPTYSDMVDIINVIKEVKGISINDILNKVNMKDGKLRKCLKFLEIDGAIYKENSKYYKSAKNWNPDLNHSDKITKIRYYELEAMDKYISTKDCYMQFISRELDDPFSKKCGKCSNCLGENIFSSSVSSNNVIEAVRFIKGEFLIIEPRKKWPVGIQINEKSKIQDNHIMEKGIVLSNYGDAGWGKIVAKNKYDNGYFSDELVQASYDLLNDKIKEWDIEWITSIPSKRRPELVRSFSIRLATKLGVKYFDAIVKKEDTFEQKSLENSSYQCNNAFSGFEIKECHCGNVLLVDDMVDSRWTLTVCTYLLKKNGAGNVYPFALAKTSGRESGE